uniref:Transposase n=1 Tax=Acrobeloides nanus TaxID=290746 RepID=A0A914DM26_9BILA
MHSFGHKQQEIADALHISQQLVSKAIILGDRPGRGRKRTARTRENILKIKRKIQRNSSSRKNSARKIAHAHRISPMFDEMVARVVDSWPDRLQACIDAEGGYIE